MAEFLAPEQTGMASPALANGQTCLMDLYDEAVRRGAVYASELKEIPEEEFVVQGVPRPPGYCAQTVLHFGRMGVTTLLDYGATCNAMPEAVAMSSISHALETYDDGNGPQYPICRMYRYRATRTMDGVAAGRLWPGPPRGIRRCGDGRGAYEGSILQNPSKGNVQHRGLPGGIPSP